MLFVEHNVKCEKLKRVFAHIPWHTEVWQLLGNYDTYGQQKLATCSVKFVWLFLSYSLLLMPVVPFFIYVIVMNWLQQAVFSTMRYSNACGNYLFYEI